MGRCPLFLLQLCCKCVSSASMSALRIPVRVMVPVTVNLPSLTCPTLPCPALPCNCRPVPPCSWSAISRRERYLKRCTDAGDELPPDSDQDLLPGEGCCSMRTATRRPPHVLVFLYWCCFPVGCLGPVHAVVLLPLSQLLLCLGSDTTRPGSALSTLQQACRHANCCDARGMYKCPRLIMLSCLFNLFLCAGVLDPVTLEPVINPAISPAGALGRVLYWALFVLPAVVVVTQGSLLCASSSRLQQAGKCMSHQGVQEL